MATMFVLDMAEWLRNLVLKLDHSRKALILNRVGAFHIAENDFYGGRLIVNSEKVYCVVFKINTLRIDSVAFHQFVQNVQTVMYETYKLVCPKRTNYSIYIDYNRDYTNTLSIGRSMGVHN